MFEMQTQLNQWFESKEDRVEQMSREITQATAELLDSQKWEQFLAAISGFHRYSFRNQILILLQKPDASRVASKSWWLENGRELLPFEQRGNGISILGGGQRTFLLKDEDGQPILDEDGNKQRQSYMSYRSVTVYDVSQTVAIDPDDDVAVALANRSQRSDDPARVQQLTDLATAAIEGAGYSVHRMVIPQNGFTDPENEGVVISSSLGDLDAAMTLCHEAAHIYGGHVSDHNEYVKHRGIMEVEAEGVAHLLASYAGVQVHADTTFYMAGWAAGHKMSQDQPLESILDEAGRNISATARTLLDSVEALAPC